MSDKEIIENQEVDAQAEEVEVENEVMESTEELTEAEAPTKDAEEKSVQATDKAADATGKAPARKGDKSNAEPSKLPGTKAGMINAAYGEMNKMSTIDMKKLLNGMGYNYKFDEGVEHESTDVEPAINYQADFSGNLSALIDNEATLSEEFKDKAAVIFEAAIKSKLSDENDRLEEKYNK